MIVVADAGPIIHLSLLGKIDLLPSLHGRIVVPDLRASLSAELWESWSKRRRRLW